MKHFLLTAFIFLMSFQASAHLPILGITTQSEDGIISAKTCPFLSFQYTKDFGKITLKKTCTLFPVQFSIVPQINNKYLQLCAGDTNVLAAFGLIALQQEGAVVSYAPLLNGVTQNYLLQSGILSTAENNYFCQGGLINFVMEHNYFLQAGVLNLSHGGPGCGYWWSGLQAGIINIFRSNDRDKESRHLSFQIGLLNYNESALLKWFPIINFSIPGLPQNGIYRLPEINFAGKTKQEVLEIINRECNGEIHLLLPYTKKEDHYNVFENLETALNNPRVKNAKLIGGLMKKRLFSSNTMDFYFLTFDDSGRVKEQKTGCYRKK